MTGDTSDISFLAEFGWYDWVWYLSPQGSEGHQDLSRKRLGRYLGPAVNVGDAMCGTVMNSKGSRMDRTSIIPLTVEDNNSDVVKKMKEVFEETLKVKLKERVKGLAAGMDSLELDEQAELQQLDEETAAHIQYEEQDMDEDADDSGKQPLPELKEVDDILDLDRYIAAKVQLPRDGVTFATAKVVKRSRDEEGELIGKSSKNPLLDTAYYEVQFEDGAVDRYSANIIAENIYSRVDDEGFDRLVLEEIIDHRSNEDAVAKKDGFIVGHNKTKQPRKTTKGWECLVQYKNGLTDWIKLVQVKESSPVQLAEYAMANGLAEEPAFAWWVPFTLRKRNRILKAMKK
jgi:hypothetical protein